MNTPALLRQNRPNEQEYFYMKSKDSDWFPMNYALLPLH